MKSNAQELTSKGAQSHKLKVAVDNSVIETLKPGSPAAEVLDHLNQSAAYFFLSPALALNEELFDSIDPFLRRLTLHKSPALKRYYFFTPTVADDQNSSEFSSELHKINPLLKEEDLQILEYAIATDCSLLLTEQVSLLGTDTDSLQKFLKARQLPPLIITSPRELSLYFSSL